MRSSIFILAFTIALVLVSPIGALSDTTTLAYSSAGSGNAVVFAGVQPPIEIEAGDFVNNQASPPQENFQNTALSAVDDNSMAGDVVSTGSYKGSVTTLLVAKESSKAEDTTLSGITTTPVLCAAAAACFVVIGAIVIVKKRADMRVPSPNTPMDKTIYYHVEVQSTASKPAYFHVNRQLTPPV